MEVEEEDQWCLLYSKYSFDVGMYYFHVDTLESYMINNHRRFTDSILKRTPNDNLWILLAIGGFEEMFALCNDFSIRSEANIKYQKELEKMDE